MGGVLANAIYDAIGVRVFQMPMTPERIKAAIKKG
jgi:CO/xanthine dehydrogenase Mo-binding subunit